MASPDLEPYVGFGAAHVHERIARWSPGAAIVENLRVDLAGEVQLRTDPAVAVRYRERCPVPGVAPEHYTLRELDLGRDGRALAGIHFVGMDVRRPFVGVRARTRLLEDGAAVARLGRRLREEFAAFAPRCFRVWQHPGDRGVAGFPGSRVDLHVVAGRLGELRARPVRETPVPVELRACRTREIYADYQAVFERFFEAEPAWLGRIQVESEERLHEAETRGVLRRAFVGGEPAGFLAALPAREQALAGFVMLEEILDKPFRGRGLARTLQRMLLDHIAADPDTLLFGHIDAENLPSLRTALGVGRCEVYRCVFLPFDESGIAGRAPRERTT